MILISVDLIILHLLETHMVLVTRFCIGCIGYVYVCHKGNCLISGKYLQTTTKAYDAWHPFPCRS